MKSIIQLGCVTLILLFSCASYATTTSGSRALEQQITKINAQQKILQQELAALKKQMRQQKSIQVSAASRSQTSNHQAPTGTQPSDARFSNLAATQTHRAGRRRFNYDRAIGIATTPQDQTVLSKPPYGYFSAERFKHGITVTTSPVLGLRSSFDSSDLLYEYPSMNEDLVLLQHRQLLEYFLRQVGGSLDNRAIIALSGGLEGQIISSRDFNRDSDGDINLSTAEIDVDAMVSRWANGYISLEYDDSSPATGSRVTNSRIYLSRGFLTLGNLNVLPVYFTIGQLYAPFGKYSTAMLTTPLTKSLARILARAAVLGYYQHGVYGEVYGFDGSINRESRRTFAEGGASLGYQTVNLKDFNIDVGAGWVSNIADSEGMQSNGLSQNIQSRIVSGKVITGPTQFAGFCNTDGANDLVHRVPALDTHAEFSYKSFTFLGEYITALRRFASQDMTFDTPVSPGRPGARISVMQLETDYTLKIHTKPVVFGLAYGRAWQSLALNLPESSWAGVISTSIWKNTMIGIEYRHDRDYATSASATGGGLPGRKGTGRSRNLVTLQFGAYF